MRLFIAIEVPAKLQERLNSAAQDLAAQCPVLRPVKEGNIHLTLHFLGECDAESVKPVERMITQTAGRHEKFQVKVGSMGWFGRRKSPTVLWAGVEESVRLEGLHSDLGAGLKGLSLDTDDRDFHPHITIGRIRRGSNARKLAKLIEQRQDSFGILSVDAVSLIKSTLTSDGAAYETLYRASLA